MVAATAPMIRLPVQLTAAMALGATTAMMPKASTMATTATNNMKPPTSRALLRLLTAIKSRKVTMAMGFFGVRRHDAALDFLDSCTKPDAGLNIQSGVVPPHSKDPSGVVPPHS